MSDDTDDGALNRRPRDVSDPRTSPEDSDEDDDDTPPTI